MIGIDSKGRTLVDIDTGDIHSGVVAISQDLNIPKMCEDTVLMVNMDRLMDKMHSKTLYSLGYVLKIAYLLREDSNELIIGSSMALYEYLGVSRVTGSRLKKELKRAGILDFNDELGKIYMSPELFKVVRKRDYGSDM